ncbi:MAG: hypothetical protein IPL34_20240 [Thiofilum sp.]|uniref:hypothetical protein n=1 Tax=Thiofilum sp. TaxID=2212733 RepID=UPI0025CD5CE9|nr:hypothetical protein [Thiofilum sp.]MBK8455612.1 hypothetical protein [Thiofilum sp.]
MASTKNVLKRSQTITQGDMSGTITSPVTVVQFLDNISIQLNFTGTPDGTFEVQVSDDYLADGFGNVQVAGTWIALPLTGNPIAAGVADQIMIDLNQLPMPNVRVVYTPTASTGLLDMYITGKEI